MTVARVAQRDRLTAARLWLPAIRGLETRLPTRVDALCERAGIARDAFEDPRRRIALGAATRLLKDAAREAGDPLFGLLAGRRHARESFDVFMRMLLAQPDFETALGIARRFASLPIDGLEVAYLRERDTIRVVTTLDEEPLRDPWIAEYVVGVIKELIDDAGDPRLRLVEAEFAHEPRAERRVYTEALESEVRFGCERTSIVLPDVNIALRNADPVLATLLADHAASLLDAIPSTKSYRERVVAVVRSRLDDESVGIESVATALAMSPRTLRRRLDEEATTFAGLLDDARRDRAIAMLRDTDRTVAEVAVAVGFASPGAFRRAFRRWTGTSASRYRTDESR